MKRFFCKVAMIATILAGGFSMTSCGEDTMGVIENVLTIWQQLNAGQTLYFDGASTVQKWTWNEANQQYEYDPTNGVATFSSHGCNISVKSTQASIAIGDFSVQGYTVSNVTIPAVTYSNGTIGQDGYGYEISFTVAKDGSTKNYATPSGDSLDFPYASAVGTISSEGALQLNVTLFMSENEAFNVVLNGKQVQK